jgi:hypothetical protein
MNFSGDRLADSHDGMDGRRLAHPVPADQGNDLSFIDVHRNVEQHLRASIAGLDGAKGE